MTTRRYIILMIGMWVSMIYPTSADACIQCVYDMLWVTFPYYTAWIKIFLGWAIIFSLLYMKDRVTTMTVLKRGGLISIGIVMSIGFHGLFPLALLILLFLWIHSYYRGYRHWKRGQGTSRSRYILYLNHCTLACLVLSAIVIQYKFLTTDVSYHMAHISAFSATSRSLHRRILEKDAVSNEDLRQILQRGNTYAKDHAALLLAQRHAPHAVEWLMEEIQGLTSEAWLPTSYQSALSDLTGQYFQTPQEWLQWWQHSQQTFHTNASQAVTPE